MNAPPVTFVSTESAGIPTAAIDALVTKVVPGGRGRGRGMGTQRPSMHLRQRLGQGERGLGRGRGRGIGGWFPHSGNKLLSSI